MCYTCAKLVDLWRRSLHGLHAHQVAVFCCFCCCILPTPAGDGIVVVVDGARFLPACTTISRILVSLWSSGGQLLAGPYEGVSQPGSDALAPVYGCKATLDAAQSSSSFDDPTATLLFQVRASPVCAALVLRGVELVAAHFNQLPNES